MAPHKRKSAKKERPPRPGLSAEVRKVWATVSKKYQTPANAIWGLFGFALLLAVSVKDYSAVLSIAVICLYLSYGLPIVARLYARLTGKGGDIGPWHLGSFSTAVAVVAILWIAFISVVFVLPPNQQAGQMMLKVIGVLLAIW